MKPRSKMLLLVVLACMAASCEKKEKVKVAESGIAPFLAEENGMRSGTRSTGPWELGVAFSVSVPGTITQLGVKFRDPARYRVTLWDFETHNLQRQKIVE